MVKQFLLLVTAFMLSISAFADDGLRLEGASKVHFQNFEVKSNSLSDYEQDVDVVSYNFLFANQFAKKWLVIGDYDTSFDGDYYSGGIGIAYGSLNSYIGIAYAGDVVDCDGVDYNLQAADFIWYQGANVTQKTYLSFELVGRLGEADINGNQLSVGGISFNPKFKYFLSDNMGVSVGYSYTKMGSKDETLRLWRDKYITIPGEFRTSDSSFSASVVYTF